MMDKVVIQFHEVPKSISYSEIFQLIFIIFFKKKFRLLVYTTIDREWDCRSISVKHLYQHYITTTTNWRRWWFMQIACDSGADWRDSIIDERRNDGARSTISNRCWSNRLLESTIQAINSRRHCCCHCRCRWWWWWWTFASTTKREQHLLQKLTVTRFDSEAEYRTVQVDVTFNSVLAVHLHQLTTTRCIADHTDSAELLCDDDLCKRIAVIVKLDQRHFLCETKNNTFNIAK